MAEVQSFPIRTSPHVEVLGDIVSPESNLAVWERDCPDNFATLLHSGADSMQFRSSLAGLGDQLPRQLRNAGFTDIMATAILADDIHMLARIFCSILGIQSVEVRLDVITTNACRKWHADYVKARLIASYVGAGTQWLEQTDADRVRDGFEPLRIHELLPGHVGIFKGRLATDSPVIHRSPPIEGTGQTRLLLVLNPGDA